MWPNEQIKGISFCGALMNGENHVFFVVFFLTQGGEQTHTQMMSLSASNGLYINNRCASLLSAGRESMLSGSTTGEV